MKIDKHKLAAAIASACAEAAGTDEAVLGIVKAFQKNALEGRYEDVQVGIHQHFLSHAQMPQHEAVRAQLMAVYEKAAAGELNATDGE